MGGQVRSGRGAGATHDCEQPLCRDRADPSGDGRHLRQHPRRRRRGPGQAPGCVGRQGMQQTRAPRSSATPMPPGRWPAVKPVGLPMRVRPVPAGRRAHPAASAVIHVLAEQATIDGTSDKPGYLPGFGILPAESVREVAKSATLKPLQVPTVAPDPGYRPTAKTLEFIRWRNLTCRWPGCDRPVERCDIDHTVPHPGGPTHPSNNKPYCRTQDWVNTLNSHCKSYHDLPAGRSVQLSHRGLSYSPKAGLIRRSQRLIPTNRGVS